MTCVVSKAETPETKSSPKHNACIHLGPLKGHHISVAEGYSPLLRLTSSWEQNTARSVLNRTNVDQAKDDHKFSIENQLIEHGFGCAVYNFTQHWKLVQKMP